MIFGLTKKCLLKLKTIFEKYEEIESVIIYGSRAKGNYREGSDIDLTLVGDKISHDLLNKILQEIDLLNIPYLFDISVYKDLKSKGLLQHIRDYGKIFYKKTEAK